MSTVCKSQVMKHIISSGNLCSALLRDELREFVQKVYDELGMSISEHELDLIWCNSCWW